jgi:drug/metabolite transporter (DMT)-like permease
MGPAAIVASRNLTAGALLLAWARLRGWTLPRGRQLWRTALYGVMVIGVGNAAIAIAEQYIPTGLASLFVTTAPFWYAGIDALLPGGERLHGPTVFGLVVGFLGVAFLVAPSALGVLQTGSFSGGGDVVLGFLILQASGASWTLGSLLQRNQRLAANAFAVAGVQQAASGLFFIPLAMLEPRPFAPDAQGVAAILYLVVFGSIVGYGCYMYILSNLPLAIVSTYTYVNPVVAVLLGWIVYREPFGPREAAAMAVIFLGVYLVRRASTAVQKLRAGRAAESRQQSGR